MAKQYKIVEKDGKKHLFEEGLLGYQDKGELHKKLDGSLETRNVFSENHSLEKKSFSQDYNFTSDKGEKSTLTKNWQGTYDLEERVESSSTDNDNYSSNTESSSSGLLGPILFILGFGLFGAICNSIDLNKLRNYTSNELSRQVYVDPTPPNQIINGNLSIYYSTSKKTYEINKKKYPKFYKKIDLNKDGKLTSYEMEKTRASVTKVINKHKEGDIEAIVKDFLETNN